MNKTKLLYLFLLCCLTNLTVIGQQKTSVNQAVLMEFTGDTVSETSPMNPFLDYRLNVEFTLGNKTMVVPGFYAADGKAAETSADSGNVWRVMFTPNAAGEWKYTVSFRKGANLAVSDDSYAGEAVKPHDGAKGTLTVTAISANAKGFEKSGRLTYRNSHYFFTEDGKPFMKFGANSPENILAYKDIDASYSYDPEKKFLKTWAAHERDWKAGDPTWKGGKGKGIIGALNYLASKEMNCVYALTFNVGGDARDVWPFINHEKKNFKRYDVSKLAQWDIIFSHAEKLGIVLQFVTQEKENELLLDDGYTGTERMLYYRELIARFGYHKNIIWNMGEENGPAAFWRQAQSDQQRFAMIRYLKDHDPYQNPLVIHTMSAAHERDPIVTPLLGFDKLDGLSFQEHAPATVHKHIKQWVAASAKAARPWIITMDEIGPYHTGTMADAEDPTHDLMRKEVLWGALLAGAAGVEWYFGWNKPPNDLNAEDWRSRNNMWEQTAVAARFFAKIPYPEMTNKDELVTGDVTYCFAKEGQTYVVYSVKDAPLTLNLSKTTGTFDVQWYDPRVGGELQKGSVAQVTGGSMQALGAAPNNPAKDWVILITKQ